MRGFEQIFMDFVDNPELVHAILERVTGFYCRPFPPHARTRRAAGSTWPSPRTIIGGQNGLLMSLKTWEEFIKPYHPRLNQAIHEFGAKVIYHTDGAVMEAVPGLIDMGIDVLQALQFSAKGMDPLVLKTRLRRPAVLRRRRQRADHAALRHARTRSARKCETLIPVLGRDGGYILGPSHAIQAGTPPENIVAMFETALKPF